MEEILASIRRIISDEETPAAEAEESAAGPEAVVEDDASAEMSQDDLDKLFDSAGDDDVAFSEPEPEPEPEAAEEADDVLELTEDLEVADADDAFEMVEALAGAEDEVGDVAFVEDAPAQEPPAASPSETVSERFTEELLSPTANQAVHSAFNNLAGTILSNNARTLEDLVKEMLRPMLKSWLDENLPPMVERLVRQEIERVSRGR